MLTKLGFLKATSKPVYVPINKDADLSLSKLDDIRTNLTEYRERIGSIMYLIVYTRLDITYTLGRLSQHIQDLYERHVTGQTLSYKVSAVDNCY